MDSGIWMIEIVLKKVTPVQTSAVPYLLRPNVCGAEVTKCELTIGRETDMQTAYSDSSLTRIILTFRCRVWWDLTGIV